MLSSAEQQIKHSSHRDSHSNNNNNKSLNRVSSTPSPSSSTSSSPSPTSQIQSKRPRTMEEVWKDINLASLHDKPPSSSITQHHHHQHHHEPRLRTHQNQIPNCIFQDFLNRPINQDPPTSLSMVSSASGDTATATALYGSPLPPPATVLSLNSGAGGFEFLENPEPLVTPESHLQSHRHLSSNVSSFNTPFEALVTSARFGCFGKKRGQDSDSSSNDRRHKRMIKNRESAARSRARKQAYTNELELEVAHLQAENARLRRQQDQLRMAAAIQLPKKNTLQRSSTAPF